MKNAILIDKPLHEVKQELEQAIKADGALILKRWNKARFLIVSKQNFGNFSMIEKEHYTITGSLKAINDQTELSYKIRPNSTFGVLSIIVPIMLLPTLLIGFMGANQNEDASLAGNSIVYFFLAGAALFFFLRQERSLKKAGILQFQQLLALLKDK